MKYKSVAIKALQNYDVEVKEIKYLTEETNIFYLVKSDSQDYVLKIFQEESSNFNDNLSEHYFIQVIKDLDGIATPEVVKNFKSETITKIPFNNKRGFKRTALYKYISGENIAGKEDLNYFEAIGKTMAKLHQATKDLVHPDYINPKKWTKIFYYENEVAVYKKRKYQKYITQEMIDILDELIPYIDQKLKEFYRTNKPQLIHADLNPWNIKKTKTGYIIYDFEEAMCAYPLHDIAVFMYYYKFNDKLNYHEVKNAFFKGYEQIKKLPENLNEKNLELIMMARRINFFNYVLTVNPNPKEYISLSFPKIKEYFLSYK